MKQVSHVLVTVFLLLSYASVFCYKSYVPKNFPKTKQKTFSYQSPQDNVSYDLFSLLPNAANVLCITTEGFPYFLDNYTCITCDIKQPDNAVGHFDAVCITGEGGNKQSLIDLVRSLDIENKPIIIGNICNSHLYGLFLSLSAELERPFTIHSVSGNEHYAVLLPIEHGKSYSKDVSLVFALTYSPSHEILAQKLLLPSLQDNFEIAISQIPQECPDAIILTPGWGKTVQRKIEHIINTIELNMGKVMLHCDADILCFSSVKDIVLQCLEGYDLAFQLCSPPRRICSGLFVARCNKKNLTFFKDVLLFMKKHDIASDQAPVNYLLNFTPWGKQIKHCFLPTTFVSGGFFAKKRFVQRKKLFLPDKMRMYHATFSKGVDSKIRQLSRVKRAVQRMKQS